MKNPAAEPAFSLTEILAATAILSVMFAIMFGILQQTSKGWQAANRKVEASQVARMALEQIARDLEFCVAVATNAVAPDGTTKTYAFGFVHQDSAASGAGVTSLAAPNDLLFVVTPDRGSLGRTPKSAYENPSLGLAEAGYYVVRATETSGAQMKGRYSLMRHWVSAVRDTDSNEWECDFLGNSENWETTPSNTEKRQVFVDNCLRFDVRFLEDGGVVRNEWPRPVDTDWAGLPPRAEITLCVVDDRTAERLGRIAPDGLGAELGYLPDQVNSIARPEVRAALQEGMTTFRRTVIFRNRQP